MVVQRLSMVDGTAGSVVGAATWCALHAQDAAIIVSVLCERLADSSVGARPSLLFVLHELLLSCAAGATVDAGKRATIGAIVALLPPAVAKALSVEGADTSELRSTLGQVIGWWESLRIFTSSWLEDLATVGCAAASPADHPSPSVEDHRDAEITTVAKLLAAYRAAKDTLHALQAEGSSTTAIENAREDAVTCLNAAIKALNEVSSKLSVQEMSELSTSSGTTAAAGTAVDLQDDVLGSFF